MEDEHLLFDEFEDFYDYANIRIVMLYSMCGRVETSIRDIVYFANTMGLRTGVWFVDRETGRVL